MGFQTLNELFFHAMETHRRPDVLRYKSGGSWQSVSWEQMLERTRDLALGLHVLGVDRGDRVVLLSENRVEWFLIDKALHLLGAATVPIYSTLTAPQVSFIIRNSEAEVVIVSSEEQAAKVAQIRSELGLVEHVILIDAPGASGLDGIRLHDVSARGADKARAEPELHRRLAAEVTPEDLASIIYTSGTTGDPKGVMLTHRNFLTNVEASLQVLPIGRSDVALSVLPYSHVFERMVAHYLYPLAGTSIAIAESADAVVENMAEIRPTVMTFVPRFYEKMYARVQETVAQGSALRRRIFSWAVSVGREHGRYRLENRKAPFLLELKYKLATALAFKKLHRRVGGRLRFFISGGAPLSRKIAEFFWAAGITILEGYGLTETSPVIAVNRPGRIKFGTVGPLIPGVEVKIAPDEEILARGPNIMKGYYKDDAATRQVIDSEGWFHTGDVGFVDADGFLAITDRKKDLIVTAGGKKIAPQPIENLLKTNPYISEVVLIGNRRRFPAALIVPDFEKLQDWSRSNGIKTFNRQEAIHNPKVIAFIQAQVDAMTSHLAQFEKIKKVGLLPKAFTLESGELTPTLKVKRNVIEEQYREEIDRLYDENL
jgi:long-chain acyl-CoA synthetase